MCNNTVSISNYIVSKGLDDKLFRRMWKRSWLNLRYYTSIFLAGLRKTTNNFSHNSQGLGPDLNRAPLLDVKTPVMTLCIYYLLCNNCAQVGV